MADKRSPWPGGYVRHGKKRDTYVIDRWVGGIHFHVSTRCSSPRAALKQLERFEADPTGYRPEGVSSPDDAVRITAELCAEFRTYMLEEKRDSKEWTREVLRHLAWWETELSGADLRSVTAATMRDAIRRKKTSSRHRVEAIKGFCSWLRDRKELLNHANDPGLKLEVPAATPARQRRRRALPQTHVEAVWPHLPPETRDVLELQSATAWHISEVRRFAATGEIIRPASRNPLAILVALHKSGDLTRVPIDTPEHLAAAERIRARGTIPIRETLVEQMRRACDAVRARQTELGIPEEDRMPHWRLGQMRHTVLTFAVDHGAPVRATSEFAQHRSERTTQIYIDSMTPTVRIPVMKLVKG